MEEGRERLRERYRMRVQNCVSTIMDVHRTLSERFGSGELVAGFEKLEAEVSRLDMAQVSEGDILLVEQATNSLLAELKKIFEAGGLGPVYKTLRN